MTDYRHLEDTYTMPTYPKRDIVVVKAKNATVWDETGKEYIDCVTGHGVANIGHCNDKVADAIAQQAKTLITCSGIFYNDVRAALSKKIVDIAPENLHRVFYTNSGAECIEAAIKFARYTTGKTDFICTMKGFHGRTMGAVTATFKKEYREDFAPLLPGFTHVPFNNFEKMAEAVTENTAAIIIELVQGEGGVNPADEEYVKNIRDLCDKKGILFIADEVQSGFCRTGKMFACEHYDLKPDMLCVAKAIAGGFPMGAVLCADTIKMDIGKHGTTFGGNPLACAAANASIDFMIEENLADRAQKLGEYFSGKFDPSKYQIVREMRRKGLMIGIELKDKSKPFLEKLMEKGILAMPAGPTVIRLLPPLTISEEELDKVIAALDEVLS